MSKLLFKQNNGDTMIELTKLTTTEKNVLRKLVLYQCESCQKTEDEVGTLEIHRLKRNHQGGIYHLRNIKILCKKCHKMYHSNEISNCKSK